MQHGHSDYVPKPQILSMPSSKRSVQYKAYNKRNKKKANRNQVKLTTEMKTKKKKLCVNFNCIDKFI